MAKLAILFFLSLCVASQAAILSCPSAEDLHPCVCKRMAYGLHVVCAKIDKNVDLIRAFKVLRDYEVQTVLLHEVNLTEVLPSDLFNDMEISVIRVEKSKLTFSQPAFTGLDESLHILNVAQNSKIKSSENFSLAQLNKLTELNIKCNPLGKVTNKWLNGKIPNVHSIILDEDEINELETEAFSELSMLTSISIAGNRIRTVKRTMFPEPATHLTKIDLSGNEIASLPYNFFFKMPVLTEIILSGNDLKTLEQNIWSTIWEQLDAVFLSENKLVCDNALDWMKLPRWPKLVDASCFEPEEDFKKSLKKVYKEDQKT